MYMMMVTMMLIMMMLILMWMSRIWGSALAILPPKELQLLDSEDEVRDGNGHQDNGDDDGDAELQLLDLSSVK